MNTNYRQQQGVGLVELMISITLSLFITAIVLSLLFSTKESYIVHDDASDIQSNARFSFLFLSKAIRHAGYKASPRDSLEGAFPDKLPFKQGQFILTEPAQNNESDKITVRLQGRRDGALEDCSGNKIPHPDTISGNEKTFYISFWVDKTEKNLLCEDINRNVHILANNIEDMHLSFGFVENNQSRYMLSKDLVNANVDTLANIKFVSVGLVMISDKKNVLSKDTNFNLFGKTIQHSDGYSRRIFTETIYIPNQVNG